MLSTIVRFQSDDFELDSTYAINIKNKNCGMIFFHVNNQESLNIGRVIADFVNDKIVPVDRIEKFIGTCNFELEPRVSNAFLKIARSDKRMSKFAINRLPCFIVYQNGFPVSFWEGGDYVNNPYTPETIGNFFTFEVCNNGIAYRPQTGRKGLNYYREGNNENPFVFGDPYTEEEKQILEYDVGMRRQSTRRRERQCDGDACYITRPTIVQMAQADDMF